MLGVYDQDISDLPWCNFPKATSTAELFRLVDNPEADGGGGDGRQGGGGGGVGGEGGGVEGAGGWGGGVVLVGGGGWTRRMRGEFLVASCWLLVAVGARSAMARSLMT